jgi:nicotinamidase-related amidase
MAKTQFESKRRRARRALLVIDMLNGFLDPKGTLYCGDAARRIVPFARETIERYRAHGDPVIFVADTHEPCDPEFRMWPAHCVRGTWEAEVIPELPVGRSPVIRKQRYSAFYGTPLQRRLSALRPRTVEVIGVCTNICVLYTVADLRNRLYNVRVLKRGVASFDPKAHRFALEQMEKVLGAEVA